MSAIVNVTVYIDDVNDNPPKFDQDMYLVELPENMTAGSRVVQVYKDLYTHINTEHQDNIKHYYMSPI